MYKRIRALFQPIQTFIQHEYASGIILMCSILVALILTNTSLGKIYHSIWETHFFVGIENFLLDHPLHYWINDGLMSVFFFVIGLELKREIIGGELSSLQKAALPFIAALGGMLFPAFVYILFNLGKETISGWGIPMATDIAIALGLLTLAGKSVPVSLKIFLTALAVVDDLGAVLVIALFYSSEISITNLMIGLGFLTILFAGNLSGIRNTYFYAIAGIAGLWYSFQASGIHPTIGGVLVAFTIPARTKINEAEYLDHIQFLSDKFEKEVPDNSSLTTQKQHSIIQQIKKISSDAETPLQKLELLLQPLVTFLVLPVFALANAGVEINTTIIRESLNSITLGIAAGLVLGKAIGISGFTWIAIKLKLGFFPESIKWKHIIGISLLGGVGFTMSLFITDLAFTQNEFVEKAKVGILFASFISGSIGLFLLKKVV